jgi:drug/metabolite transporter (DMT)-like permease
MLAVLGGLGAALAFATATLCNARAARMIGAGPLLAWVMLVGLLLVAPVVAVREVPDDLDADAVRWLALAGAGNLLGLFLAYRALTLGKVGIVAPILSTEGAITAVISVAAGERLAVSATAVLVIIAVGVMLAAGSPDPDPRATSRSAPALAVGAAVAFGVGLYATARVSATLPVVWAVLPARLLGVALITLPLALRGRLRIMRPAVPLVLLSGFCEVAGFFAFGLGSRHGIAVSAVLASQFGGMAAVAAYALFGERLARVQVAGVATVVAGVALLSAIQA